jgi:hypothetical protein
MTLLSPSAVGAAPYFSPGSLQHGLGYGLGGGGGGDAGALMAGAAMVAVSAGAAAVESADGRRWTELALDQFHGEGH